MRAVIFAALVGCSSHVIDLGHRTDAGPDALEACACRVVCQATTASCTGLGECGSDGYCTLSTGACTLTTPEPCGPQPASLCMKSATSTTRCGM